MAAGRLLEGSPRRRRQLALGDLVEQSLVADPEHPGRLGTIPLHSLEHFLKRFALGFARAAARDFLQALAAELGRSEEHTSELQSLAYLVCRLLLEKKKIQGLNR